MFSFYEIFDEFLCFSHSFDLPGRPSRQSLHPGRDRSQQTPQTPASQPLPLQHVPQRFPQPLGQSSALFVQAAGSVQILLSGCILLQCYSFSHR